VEEWMSWKGNMMKAVSGTLIGAVTVYGFATKGSEIQTAVLLLFFVVFSGYQALKNNWYMVIGAVSYTLVMVVFRLLGIGSQANVLLLCIPVELAVYVLWEFMEG
jgi:hypothetical protein